MQSGSRMETAIPQSPAGKAVSVGKTLLISVPYGIGWKNIVDEEVLQELEELGVKIIVLAEEEAGIASHRNVSVEKLHRYVRGKFEMIFGVMRNYVFADTSRSFSETIGIKTLVYEKQKPFIRLLRRTVGRSFSGSRWFRELLRRLDLILFPDKYYGELFERSKPCLVFVPFPFSPYNYPVLRRAAKSKIPLISYVPSWDNLTSKWEVPAKIDRLIVWNDFMKMEAVELLGYRPQDVYVCGIPQFDGYTDESLLIPREEFIRRMSLDPSKKLITYATGTPQLSTSEPEIVDVLYNCIVEGRFSHPCQLLLRLHPRRSFTDFQSFKDKPDVAIQQPGTASREFAASGYFWDIGRIDTTLLANTLKHSDVLVNVASTVTIEACIFDTPVVNVAFDGYTMKPYWQSVRRFFDYTHYKRIAEAGGVRIAHGKEELVKHIDAYLKDRTLDSGGRRRIVAEQCFMADGKAKLRMIQSVIDYMNSVCGWKDASGLKKASTQV